MGEGELGVGWPCRMYCPRHRLVLEYPLLPVRKSCAIPTLVLQLRPGQHSAAKVLPHLLCDAGCDEQLDRSVPPAGPHPPRPHLGPDHPRAPLPDLQFTVYGRLVVRAARCQRQAGRVPEKGEKAGGETESVEQLVLQRLGEAGHSAGLDRDRPGADVGVASYWAVQPQLLLTVRCVRNCFRLATNRFVALAGGEG